MSEEHILIDRDDKNIVTITLNRPEKLNTLTKTMWGRLGDISVSYTHLTLPTIYSV